MLNTTGIKYIRKILKILSVVKSITLEELSLPNSSIVKTVKIGSIIVANMMPDLDFLIF
jgi:hypothetical protein